MLLYFDPSCQESHTFDLQNYNDKYNRLLALLVKKLQIFVKKILIEKYNFN
ncbi:hypothetical protein [Spiroplasma poulsonii]|uniref:hypothetical protein n=1 Tax=Spiroplasma poulsonii TaxID=2138 RepID=UPI001F54830E|nr:hypothetical protein [Spiroplasma poulsonii]